MTSLRGWSRQESTARSLIALAERRAATSMTGPRAGAESPRLPSPRRAWGAGVGSETMSSPTPARGLVSAQEARGTGSSAYLDQIRRSTSGDALERRVK